AWVGRGQPDGCMGHLARYRVGVLLAEPESADRSVMNEPVVPWTGHCRGGRLPSAPGFRRQVANGLPEPHGQMWSSAIVRDGWSQPSAAEPWVWSVRRAAGSRSI